MSSASIRADQVEAAALNVTMPEGFTIRAWTEADFPSIQLLNTAENWPTTQDRPDEALMAWRASWPTLVALQGSSVVGYVRALTDTEITIYIAELMVEASHRGKGIGRALLDACHALYPHTRLDLLSLEGSATFYEASGFRKFRGYRRL